jgi:release factor glutamine methyltransferase
MIELAALVRAATGELAAAGVESPRVDAELLAAHVLGVARGRLLVIDSVTPEQATRIRGLVALRARRIPLQHLTGTAPFLGLELAVGPGVFIPRPETELLAEWAIAAIAPLPHPVVVDLCSGSGALALAIAHHRPDVTVYAVERSPAALEWLHRNASGTIVEVIEGDIRDVPIPAPVDLVIANPPYVPRFHVVPPEVLKDPQEAVFGGEDGLDLIPAVISRAAALLRPGGRLGVEHDETHDLSGLLDAGFERVELHRDLAGRPRWTTAARRAW